MGHLLYTYMGIEAFVVVTAVVQNFVVASVSVRMRWVGRPLLFLLLLLLSARISPLIYFSWRRRLQKKREKMRYIKESQDNFSTLKIRRYLFLHLFWKMAILLPSSSLLCFLPIFKILLTKYYTLYRGRVGCGVGCIRETNRNI